MSVLQVVCSFPLWAALVAHGGIQVLQVALVEEAVEAESIHWIAVAIVLQVGVPGVMSRAFDHFF